MLGQAKESQLLVTMPALGVGQVDCDLLILDGLLVFGFNS